MLPESFSATLLARALGQSPSQMVASVDEAIRADLLTDAGDDLTFRHDLVRRATQQTIPYALFHLQPRGILFVNPGEAVYEGMIVGEHNRPNDLDVNVCKEKKLTNIRAAGRDENIIISTPRRLTIEAALDHIDQDELVELTPDAIRLRKRVLDKRTRPRRTQA